MPEFDQGSIMESRIEIEIYATQKIIHAYVSGTMSETARNSIGAEVVRTMRANGITKVIWDIRETKLAYSVIGSHLAVLNLPALGVTKDDYVAVIYSNNKDQHEHARTVAQNRSIRNIGYFQDIEEGIDWLTGIA